MGTEQLVENYRYIYMAERNVIVKNGFLLQNERKIHLFATNMRERQMYNAKNCNQSY